MKMLMGDKIKDQFVLQQYREKEPQKNDQNIKIANVAGSVCLSLFVDHAPSIGLSRIQNLNMVIVNFEF